MRRALVTLAMLIPVTADADIDRNVIRRVIDRHRDELRQCYERAVAKDPKLAGTVSTQFDVLGSGRVGTVVASGMPAINACIEDVIRTLVFPKPPGGGRIQISYPFAFHTK